MERNSYSKNKREIAKSKIQTPLDNKEEKGLMLMNSCAHSTSIARVGGLIAFWHFTIDLILNY